MPGGDRTRPMGVGPRTGRGAGYCAGHGVPGYSNPIPSQGFGWGELGAALWAEAGGIVTGTMRQACHFGHARALMPCPCLWLRLFVFSFSI